jgi:cytochrome c biogenesis protein CcmG, thiol:disulfide interchange protein DsbE
VVLNFFTHVVHPVHRRAPRADRVRRQQRNLGGDGAEFYSIVVDEHPRRGRGVLRRATAETGRSCTTPTADFAVAFGVAQVPETWIIDPNGMVRGGGSPRSPPSFLGSSLQLMREQFTGGAR